MSSRSTCAGARSPILPGWMHQAEHTVITSPQAVFTGCQLAMSRVNHVDART